MGNWMVDAVDWADQNRRGLLWTGLFGICSELVACKASGLAVTANVHEQSLALRAMCQHAHECFREYSVVRYSAVEASRRLAKLS